MDAHDLTNGKLALLEVQTCLGDLELAHGMAVAGLFESLTLGKSRLHGLGLELLLHLDGVAPQKVVLREATRTGSGVDLRVEPTAGLVVAGQAADTALHLLHGLEQVRDSFEDGVPFIIGVDTDEGLDLGVVGCLGFEQGVRREQNTSWVGANRSNHVELILTETIFEQFLLEVLHGAEEAQELVEWDCCLHFVGSLLGVCFVFNYSCAQSIKKFC